MEVRTLYWDGRSCASALHHLNHMENSSRYFARDKWKWNCVIHHTRDEKMGWFPPFRNISLFKENSIYKYNSEKENNPLFAPFYSWAYMYVVSYSGSIFLISQTCSMYMLHSMFPFLLHDMPYSRTSDIIHDMLHVHTHDLFHDWVHIHTHDLSHVHTLNMFYNMFHTYNQNHVHTLDMLCDMSILMYITWVMFMHMKCSPFFSLSSKKRSFH